MTRPQLIQCIICQRKFAYDGDPDGAWAAILTGWKRLKDGRWWCGILTCTEGPR